MRGKVVLITGASSGIGAGTASHLASLGCLLSLTGRNQEGLRETLQSCLRAGCKEEDVLLIPADLQDTSNLPSIVEKTVEKFGRLDVLINNAAMFKIVDIANTSEETYDQIMNTNLKAVFFLTKYAVPHLIKSGGNVVNISTVGSQRASDYCMAYCMSKAALDHFTRMLAVDLGSKGVRVNSVNPGAVKTPIWDRAGFRGDYNEFVKKVHLLGRDGTLEEVARAITFLADEKQSSFITGVVLNVDGGAVLMGPA